MTENSRVLLISMFVVLLAGCQSVAPRPSASEAIALSEAGAAAAVELPLESLAVDAPEAMAHNPAATGSGAEVFARIKRGLGPNSCAAGGEGWRKRYAGNPRAFSRHLAQILPLLDFVSLEVERTGLPAEFVFIPLVESWYRPEAMGVGGPAGMWQMISSTSRNHGIHIKNGYDGRLSPVESTRAALSYLKTLQGMFGGWQAIVMAYNAGEGRLMQAFRRSSTREVSAANRKPHGLSNITYDYVGKLQALSCLVSEPGRHGLTLPASARFVPLAAVLADEKVDSLEQLAASRGKDAAELRRLNPGFKNGRIVAGVPRLVLMPFATDRSTPVGAGEAAVQVPTATLLTP